MLKDKVYKLYKLEAEKNNEKEKRKNKFKR